MKHESKFEITVSSDDADPDRVEINFNSDNTPGTPSDMHAQTAVAVGAGLRAELLDIAHKLST